MLARMVRPLGGFDPLSISGCVIWYDATYLTQGGGIVTAITNKGTGGNPTINAGEEPAYTASNGSYNNRPTWKCGTAATKVIRAANTHGMTTGARTIVVVGQCSNTGYALGTPSGNTNVAGGGGSGDKWQGTSDAFGTILVSGSGLANNPSVMIIVLNGGSSSIYVSSTTATTGGSGALEDLTSSTIMIGNYGGPTAATGQDGDTTHFLIYNAALNLTQCTYLLNGFGAQSGITIS
jgi:hypothetical protein